MSVRHIAIANDLIANANLICTFVFVNRDLRQVPDNQEVLLSPTSNLTHIVEILEAVEVGQSDEKAVR